MFSYIGDEDGAQLTSLITIQRTIKLQPRSLKF